jgi:type IV secretory pathway component VirB8
MVGLLETESLENPSIPTKEEQKKKTSQINNHLSILPKSPLRIIRRNKKRKNGDDRSSIASRQWRVCY